MNRCNAPPKEGELYKIITIGNHSFELRFGYYADFERINSEPVVIYPNLSEKRLYDIYGYRIVTAIQDPCDCYEVHTRKTREDCCNDCIHYADHNEGIGVCTYTQNNKDYVTLREGE